MIILQEYWPGAATFLSVLLSIICSGHAILNKTDSRSALGWVGIVWLVPFFGAFLYFIFGINRVRRLARILREDSRKYQVAEALRPVADRRLIEKFPSLPSLVTLAHLGATVTGRPLLNGNEIIPLINGDAAFPRMLAAIRRAKTSISLSTYIFDNDVVGKQFIDALSDAVDRGVDVKVLIDDIGLRYSWRPVLKSLKNHSIPVARFMGAFRPMTFPHFNLRKHRKILIIDSELAFTGGMNIRQGHQLSLNPKHPVTDLHFQVKGPLVFQLQEVFSEDWTFTTNQPLDRSIWFKEPVLVGETFARVITEGPDEDSQKLSLIIEGAIAGAQDSIWILTPYFLPDSSMARTLSIAASKGVKVNIVLPRANNLPFVQWASNPQLLPLLKHGCKIWFTPPPFDHTKLMLIDGSWILFGSANLDPRSLRLNFELNVECYDAVLGESLKQLILRKIRNADQLTEAQLSGRAMHLKLRDGVARLFSPYL